MLKFDIATISYAHNKLTKKSFMEKKKEKRIAATILRLRMTTTVGSAPSMDYV
jgi:hypothetical protein